MRNAKQNAVRDVPSQSQRAISEVIEVILVDHLSLINVYYMPMFLCL